MKMKMKIIGITGGSGAGKGEVSHCFLSAGIRSLDTDKVSRAVCEPGKPCLAELSDCFGTDILRADGSLDRHYLASLVFGEPDETKRAEKLAALNRITHAHILAEVEKWLAEREKEGDAFAVIDAPQLFESGFDKKCDYTIGVVADEDVRLRRIVARDGITKEAAQERLRAQKPNEFFEKNCGFIVVNNSGLEALDGQVANILRQIGAE